MPRAFYRGVLPIVAALLAVVSTAGPAAAVGACNGAGCWAMKIFTIKAVRDTGDVWVSFETDKIDPLHDGGSFNDCTVKLTSTQGARPSLLVSASDPGTDAILAQLLLAFASGQQVSFRVEATGQTTGSGVPLCGIGNFFFYRAGCDNATATCP